MFTTPIRTFRRRTRQARGIYYAKCLAAALGSQGPKAPYDHFASLGINHKCIHAVFYYFAAAVKGLSSPYQLSPAVLGELQADE